MPGGQKEQLQHFWLEPDREYPLQRLFGEESPSLWVAPEEEEGVKDQHSNEQIHEDQEFEPVQKSPPEDAQIPWRQSGDHRAYLQAGKCIIKWEKRDNFLIEGELNPSSIYCLADRSVVPKLRPSNPLGFPPGIQQWFSYMIALYLFII